MQRSAEISACGRYRYRLDRQWRPSSRTCVFVMLNPSTADAEQDDPTIRRCVGFATQWGCGRLVVVNLFGLRATNPRELYSSSIDPIGPENDNHLLRAAEETWDVDESSCGIVVCAWGNHGALHGRGDHVRRLLEREHFTPRVLRLTAAGQPPHPLYLPRTLTPNPWTGEEAR